MIPRRAASPFTGRTARAAVAASVRRGTPAGPGISTSPAPAPIGGSRTLLGAHRWVVEQTFALLHWFRRLRNLTLC